MIGIDNVSFHSRMYLFIWLKEYEENIDIARGYYGEKHKLAHSLGHAMFKTK